MESMAFTYNISLSDYRKMMYFNTFSIRRLQSLFVIVAWIVSASLFVMEKANVIDLTQVTYVCCLVVTISIPMIVIGLEMKIKRTRSEETLTTQRTVTFKNEGIRYQGLGSTKTATDSWKNLMAVYETRSIFIIYRDDKRVTLIPKRGESPERLQQARQWLKEMLGSRYKLR